MTNSTMSLEGLVWFARRCFNGGKTLKTSERIPPLKCTDFTTFTISLLPT